jgi:glycopeptide antibiotics resistance protein
MDLARFDDVAQNVLLFVPLGAIIASLGSRRISLTLLGAAIALPFVIELTQLVVRPLDRSCQSADVFDNLTGLLIGYAVIAIVRAARRHGHGQR